MILYFPFYCNSILVFQCAVYYDKMMNKFYSQSFNPSAMSAWHAIWLNVERKMFFSLYEMSKAIVIWIQQIL